MTEFEMLESGKILTDAFGILYIKTIILEYEYPRCFIATDENNKLFALLENDDSIENFGWNLTKIGLDDLNKVNRGTLNIQSLFLNKESYLLNYDAINGICCAKKVDFFSGEYEIKGNMFVKDFCEMDELFDFHGLQNIANLYNKSSISFVLDSDGASKTSVIFKIINYLKAICKNLKNGIDIFDSEFSVQHASTVITFNFENTMNGSLFGDQVEQDKYNAGVMELGNLLSANEPEQIMSEASDLIAIKKYSKMIETLNDEIQSRPKVILAVPKREKVSSFDFGKKNCEKKKKLVDEAHKMYEENLHTENREFEEKGILTGILTGDKNQFSFRANNGIQYRGTVDFSLVGNDSQFNVNGAIYSAIIQETKVFKDDAVSKTSYKLLKLNKIEDVVKYRKTSLF